MLIQKYCRHISTRIPFLPMALQPTSVQNKDQFSEFIKNYDNILVLTGAGVSTGSGIPDYRSKSGLFNKPDYKPITYTEFINSQEKRTRYWARNYYGWPRFSTLEPNPAHRAIHGYQAFQKFSHLITQNVDGLHHRAGSREIVELHGNSYWVRCRQCANTISRYDFQRELTRLNPDLPEIETVVRPDGDVEIDEEIYSTFKVPDCDQCGGILKPTVVFFGENIPPARVKKVEGLVEKCDALLVMGTTLSTQSSLRIVNQAFELCKFICIVNLGETRGDKMADLLINHNCLDIFPDIKRVGDY